MALLPKHILLSCYLPGMAMAAMLLSATGAQSADSFPRWSQFPKAAQSVPKPAEFARRVRAQERISTDLSRKVKALNWDQDDPETLARNVRNQIDPEQAKAVDPASTEAEINAFASDLRRRVSAPAQIDRFEDVPVLRPN